MDCWMIIPVVMASTSEFKWADRSILWERKHSDCCFWISKLLYLDSQILFDREYLPKKLLVGWVAGGEERKRSRQLNRTFDVWNALYELSIYREKSQLISEKLWEQVIQVIHILDLRQKISQSSTKIYHIEYKNILYYVPKYISDQTIKYIRLSTKIFLIVFQNILDYVPKYFSKTWRSRKHTL